MADIAETIVVDGRKIAADIIERLKARPKPAKFLAAIQVGDDAATASFIGLKEKVAKQLGVDFRLYKFPATATNDELRKEFGAIAAHKTCGGVMVELPLPEQLNWYYVLNAIPPEKDVDVLCERALGAFYVGRSKVLPPAVGAVEEVLKSLEGKILPLELQTVAIVGLGLLIGRPVTNWIMRRAKETILFHSGSRFELLLKADLIITGVGAAGLIETWFIKEGAGIIDFGYDQGKGDFNPINRPMPTTVKPSFYTPTPGGTGPILVAKLFENFYKLNQEA